MENIKLIEPAVAADAVVPAGTVLVWVEEAETGDIRLRYKKATGTTGELAASARSMFAISLVNAAVARGHGGSGGPGAGLDAIPPAVLAVDENTIFDHNQSIL